MARYDFRAQRLHVDDDLGPRVTVPLERKRAHYLVHVMRLREGADVHVFNGRDGEWRAALRASGGKAWALAVAERTREQTPRPDLDYLFVPLKQARLDYMVQKAVEMGAGLIAPVTSDHGQVGRINRERMEANVIEAAEQCGVLAVPGVAHMRSLAEVLDGWDADPGRRLVFADEASPLADPVAVLHALAPGPMAVLVGPEGGFSSQELERLREAPFAVPLPLGPRILRADTAAVAALALVQAVVGDWRSGAPLNGV